MLEHFWRSFFFLFQRCPMFSSHFLCGFFCVDHLQVSVCAYGRIDIFSHDIILPDDAASSVV
jgi:hypothetical protein